MDPTTFMADWSNPAKPNFALQQRTAADTVSNFVLIDHPFRQRAIVTLRRLNATSVHRLAVPPNMDSNRLVL
jgi:hypothetical protein